MALIDLSQLPAPTVVEAVSFESIYNELRDDFLQRWAALRADNPALPAIDTLDQETDPLAVLMQALAYREMRCRARINDAARSVLLAFAAGADLDHKGATLNVARFAGELDAVYRRRVQTAPGALSKAGPVAAYISHALSTVAGIRDASVERGADGALTLTVLANAADPVPTEAQLEAIRAALDGAENTPATDILTVQGPTVVETAISVRLQIYPGPDGAAVKALAVAQLQALADRVAYLGYDLPLSAIDAAATAAGVQRVTILSPGADLVTDAQTVIHVTSITVTVAGRDI